MVDLDEAEHEGLVSGPATDETTPPVDLRDVANSGLALLAPIQLIALGPIAVGIVAVFASASSAWDRFPMISQDPVSFSERLAVPNGIAFGALSPSLRRELDAQLIGVSKTEGIPALLQSVSEPSIMDFSTELAALDIPAPTFDFTPAPQELIPQAPELQVQ